MPAKTLEEKLLPQYMLYYKQIKIFLAQRLWMAETPEMQVELSDIIDILSSMKIIAKPLEKIKKPRRRRRKKRKQQRYTNGSQFRKKPLHDINGVGI